jgi:hypothetical protein
VEFTAARQSRIFARHFLISSPARIVLGRDVVPPKGPLVGTPGFVEDVCLVKIAFRSQRRLPTLADAGRGRSLPSLVLMVRGLPGRACATLPAALDSHDLMISLRGCRRDSSMISIERVSPSRL